MFCYNCGKQINNNEKFCPNCGTVFTNDNTLNKENIVNNKSNSESTDSKPFINLFIDKDEKMVSLLGSSYVMNYASLGEFKKGACLLTDKRIYYKGNSYKKSGEHLIKNNEETIVDVKDITASGFIESVNTGLLIRSWILLILTLFMFLVFPSPMEVWDDIVEDFNCAMIYIVEAVLIFFTIISVVKYSLQKVRLFYIAFAGGTLSFNATDYSHNDIREFNRALRKVISSKHYDNN